MTSQIVVDALNVFGYRLSWKYEDIIDYVPYILSNKNITTDIIESDNIIKVKFDLCMFSYQLHDLQYKYNYDFNNEFEIFALDIFNTAISLKKQDDIKSAINKIEDYYKELEFELNNN